MFIKKSTIAVSFIILLSGILAACQTTPEAEPPMSAGIAVEITDALCPNVEIIVGQQVTWTNKGEQAHLVQASSTEGNTQFSSGTLQPEDSFTFTFSEVGSYPYACSADSAGAVSGTITVQPE
jgi:plastocyanin